MEEVNIGRFIFAFVFVLGLIGLFALALKRWGGRLTLPKAGKAARLRVLESCYLGPRHRLVLIARDEVEHVLLLGPEGQLVVESGIGRKTP